MKEKASAFWGKFVSWFQYVFELFTTPLFKLGESEISLSTIIYIIIAFVILNFVAIKSKSLLVKKVLKKTSLEHGVSSTIGTITKFLILLIGSIIIVQSAGIDLSALSLIAGALGVGIGFGLQKHYRQLYFRHHYPTRKAN